MAVEEHDDEEDVEEEENEEEEEREEEEEENEERRRAGPSLDVVKVNQKNQTRTLLAQRHAHTRTEDNGIMDGLEEEEEEDVEDEEEKEHAVGPCQWDSTIVERELHKVSFWHHRGHRQ